MTATATTATTSAEPIKLPEHYLACPLCGQPVPEPAGSVVVEVHAHAREGVPIPLPSPAVTRLARCPDCRGRRARAEALCLDRPELGRQLGDRVAVHRAELALAGLAAIGAATPALLAGLDDPGVHRPLLRNLAAPAGSVVWSSRCAPVVLAQSGPGWASPTPFATAPPQALALLRVGYGKLLAERVALAAPPVAVSPPPAAARSGEVAIDGGCMCCGVGAVTVAAAEVARAGGADAASRQLWRGLTVTRRADRLAGYLCPPCAAAYEQVGSWGPSTAERACLTRLDVIGRTDDARSLRNMLTDPSPPRIAAWSTLVHAARLAGRPAPTPSAQGWQHVELSR